MKTLKDVLNDIEDFVENHNQLKQYGFGKIENITTKNFNYPLFWVNSYSHSYRNKTKIYSLTIDILTLLQNELENEDVGISDMLVIFNDFLSYFHNKKDIYGFKIDDEIEIDTINDEFDDKLIGIEPTIYIEIFESLCVEDLTPSFSCSYTEPDKRYKSLDIPISLEIENFDEDIIQYNELSFSDFNDGTIQHWDSSSTPLYTENHNNKLRITNTGSGNRITHNANWMSAGKTYKITFDYEMIQGEYFDLRRYWSGSYIVNIPAPILRGSGTYSYYMKPDTDYPVNFYPATTSSEITIIDFDNIRVEEVVMNGNRIEKTFIDTSKNKTKHTFNTSTPGSYSNEIDKGVRITCMVNPSVDAYGQSFTTSVERIEYSNKRNNIETTKNYTLKYHYKKLDGDVDKMYWRIGEYSNQYSGWYNIPGEEGDVEISIDGYIANNNHNYIRIYFEAGRMFDVEITNIKLIQTDFNSFIDYDGSFGNNEYRLVTSDGTEYVCENFIAVPEPNKGIELMLPDADIKLFNHSDYNSKIDRIYRKAGDLFINWGDGKLEKFTYTSASYSVFYHDYVTKGRKPIDIYGSGFDGLHQYTGTRMVFDYDWFELPDLGTDNIHLFYNYYNSVCFGNVENMQLSINAFYSYYFDNLVGDITKSKIITAEYMRFYDVRAFSNYEQYTMGVGLYGDVGTMLKGRWSSSGYYYKTYFDLLRSGLYTYQDRIDAPIRIKNRLLIRGYNTSTYGFQMNNADELCQLIIDLDTWRVGTIPNIDIRYNTPLTSSPLYSDFLTAKNNMVADGTVFYV